MLGMAGVAVLIVFYTVGYTFVKIFGPTLGRYCSREYSRQYYFRRQSYL